MTTIIGTIEGERLIDDNSRDPTQQNVSDLVRVSPVH